MKAWILSDVTSGDCGNSLVFADTVNEAKKQMRNDEYIYSFDFEDLDWIDIRCKRAKEFDDMDNKSELDICIKLMKEYGWSFEIEHRYECKVYTENNIDEFIQWYKRGC